MKYKHLSIWEREKIQELFWLKKSIRYTAEVLNRSPASISRELRRNFPKELRMYTPRLAHERALFKRTCRGRTERLKTSGLREYVVESCNHKPGVNTLLERKTGLFLITKVEDKTSRATVLAVEKRMSALPEVMKKTITLDNGPENRDWQMMEEKTKLKTFFAHPYHSWERGANENANGLLREYFPKGTDFATISDEDLAAVEYRLNSRPRKRLGWLSPLQAMSVALQG